MAKYDDASWHYGGDYPKDLPKENGSTHIGFFIAWCIENQMLSQFQIEESGEDVQRFLKRDITGRDFFLNNCDEKFTDEDLNDLGNQFAADYYSDEGEFSKSASSYLADFQTAVEMYHQEFRLPFTSPYHLDDSWQFYDAFKTIIEDRFVQWKEFRELR